MLSPRSTPPWLGYPLLLALLPLVFGEAIIDSVVTPLGDVAELTHSHPAFGGLIRGEVVKPVVPNEQNKKAVRSLEEKMSDIERLEAYFGSPMETNFNELKASYSSGSCDVLPWSGDYWPTYKDGINTVWKDGDMSPAEKYATAFGIDVDAFKDGISLSTGVLSESYTDCTVDSDCDDLGDGSLCGIRDGDSTGYCIPTWHGICHAWASAALFEAEPKCDVVKNNVTFHSVDMKALISQLYDGAAISVVFTGVRFNGPDSPEELDKYGRYVDAARADMNPAFLHIAAANALGKHQKPFIVDVSSDSQVWNQPVQTYEVLEAEIVDPAALSQEYFDTDSYPFNDDMAFLANCTMRLTWTAESIEDGALTTTGRIAAYTVYEDYAYCLELDENYTIVGGEWLASSCKNHPDFLWFPAAKPTDDTVTDTGISYADVLDLIEQSLQCVDVTVSPDVPDSSSTKKPGTEYTKTPVTKSPTKTPAPTTEVPPTSTDSSQATYTPETTAPATYTPVTYIPEKTAPVTYTPEPTAPSTYTPETTAPPVSYTPTPLTKTPKPTETKAPAPSKTPRPMKTTPTPTTGTPNPTPTKIPAPTKTPTPTQTPKPKPTKTPSPTQTPSPTKTPKPKPTRTTPATTAPSTYPPQTYSPVTYTPETTAPSTYTPETTSTVTYTPETTAPSTLTPETTTPATYTPYPGLICYGDTPAPSSTEPPTYAPSETPSTYPTETPVATTALPTQAPTYAPTQTPTVTPTYAPTPTPTYTTPKPTSKATSAPKTPSPASQSNQSPTQSNKKWYRRLGEFTLWW